MAAAKVLDAIGRFPGCDEEDSDAIKAYTQVKLSDLPNLLGQAGGKEVHVITWVSLPRNRQPSSWRNIQDPVCILRRNLYGHPLAGLIWEKYCQKAIFKIGFSKVPGWECLFYHAQDKLFLSVYVDDLRMAGRKPALKDMWAKLNKELALEPAVPSLGNTYLGCQQRPVKLDDKAIGEQQELMLRLLKGISASSKLSHSQATEKPDAPDRGAKADRLDAIPNSKSKTKTKSKGKMPVSSEQQSAGREPLLTADTGEDPSQVFAWNPNHPRLYKGPIQSWVYDMHGHAEGCVERYCSLAGKSAESLTKVATPCMDDHQFTAEDLESKGTLAAVAARIVLKVLYLSRMGRPDTLWSVNTLARKVTCWNGACDKRLHRLISYLRHTQDWTQTCYVGDHPDDCFLVCFCDASFAGDLEDSKSTSGAYVVLMGPRTFVPVTWLCKKQGAVSHSSTEAEVIALDAAMRMECLPLLVLWELVLSVFGRGAKADRPGVSSSQVPDLQEKNFPPTKWFPDFPDLRNLAKYVDYVPSSFPPSSGVGKLIIFEDNDAVIKICIKGRSPNLRHVNRTRRVDLDWLNERIQTDPGVFLKFCPTRDQLADIFTKGSFSAELWNHLCKIARIGKWEILEISKRK